MSLEEFGDYAFTLGDEMRERRAALDLSLEDAERDLRIRASTILAIESGDLSGFPSEGVIPGYVRSYARYLGMDPQRSYRRFCDETGFKSPAAAVSGRAGGKAARGRGGADLTQSRFAPPPAPDRIGSRVSLGAVGSAVAMVALVGGLSFGGYQLLQDIQKVGVAPLPEVPEVVVEARPSPEDTIRVATADPGGIARPDASAYEDGGILALAQASDPLPPRLTSRDGPIADLDPNDSGLFAGVNQLDPNDPRREGPPPAAEAASDRGQPESAQPSGWEDGVLLASLSARAMMDEPVTDAERLTMSARAETQALAPMSRATVIKATDEAWIRVRDGDGTVVFEGILAPGDTFELPERMKAPEIRAGNAGGVFIAIGGETYGPLGAPGQVVKNVSLDEEDVREAYPAAEIVEPASIDGPVQRAHATL